jgi:hypothetical protein
VEWVLVEGFREEEKGGPKDEIGRKKKRKSNPLPSQKNNF